MRNVDNTYGVVYFVGNPFVGVGLDDPLPDAHDGVMLGKRYFHTAPRHGIFVDAEFLHKVPNLSPRTFNRAHKKRARPEPAKGDGSKKAKVGEKVADESLADEIREQLRLPQAMKLKLIEDWERITREKKLVPLPRETSIATLLDDFLQAKSKRTSHERLYGEVCDGVKAYFNQALPTILLYKYERRQFREIREQDKTKAPSELYGAEHLLRLFVKFPELLSRCNMQREHMTVLVSKLAELLKFLVTQKAKFFVADYDAPPDEYLAWWGSEDAS